MKYIGILQKDGFNIRVSSGDDGTYVLDWTRSGFMKKERRIVPSKEKLIEILRDRFVGHQLLEMLAKL